MSKIVYIAGPITGVENYKKYFDDAHERLLDEGYEVINPARLHYVMNYSASHADYMDVCRVLVTKADAIYLLKEWENSAGAREELKYFIEARKEIMLEEE